MPDARRRTCSVCLRRDDDVGPISWRGKCSYCAKERMLTNLDSMHDKDGEWWQRRRYRLALAEFGPRWALAMKQAGEFDAPTVDTAPHSP